MYENTQHSKGIKAVKTSLDNFPIETMATKVITTFLSLVITLNKFVFNCKNYIQIKGCAMGTIVPYANLFVGHFERKYTSRRAFITLFKVQRYILYTERKQRTVYSESKEQLIQNLDELNTKHDSIKFE